jgi:hypothetical protein
MLDSHVERKPETNAPIFASSELLETLREGAYVRGRRDPFLVTEELALLATDLVAAFEPSHAAVGGEPITAPFGTYLGITEQVIMSRTPGSFRSVLLPQGSRKPEWLAP